jgi:hypothetical protein
MEPAPKRQKTIPPTRSSGDDAAPTVVSDLPPMIKTEGDILHETSATATHGEAAVKTQHTPRQSCSDPTEQETSLKSSKALLSALTWAPNYAGDQTDRLEETYWSWESKSSRLTWIQISHQRTGAGKQHDTACLKCFRPEIDLSCVTCQRSFHTACLKEGFSVKPINNAWWCPLCVKRCWNVASPVPKGQLLETKRQNDRPFAMASHFANDTTFLQKVQAFDNGLLFSDHQLLLFLTNLEGGATKGRKHDMGPPVCKHLQVQRRIGRQREV